MKAILKYARANVRVTDNETGKVLFEDHNLFVDSGRAFVADTLRAAISGSTINPALYVCDLGDSSQTPDVDDVDLVSYLTPLSMTLVAGYPAALSGEPTGIHFQFLFDNTGFGGDKTIRELGLFYRPDSDDFPRRGSNPASMLGTMLARLKTSLSSLVVGDTRSITIDWKILF